MSEPAPSRGPLERAARLSVAVPDVLADATQNENGRVWALSVDVLPGAVMAPGSAVVAAWGAETWTATVRWDSSRPDLLWLTPQLGPEVPLLPSVVYPWRMLASAVEDGLRDALWRTRGDSTPAPDELASAVHDVVASVLVPVLRDVDAAVETLRAAIEQSRRDIWDFLNEQPQAGAGLFHEPAWQRLLGRARRATAPRRASVRRSVRRR